MSQSSFVHFFCCRLFTIIKEYGVPVEAEHLALFQTLVPSFQHLKTTILFYEAKKDDNILHFSGDLDQQIDKLRYQLFSLKNKVRRNYEAGLGEEEREGEKRSYFKLNWERNGR